MDKMPCKQCLVVMMCNKKGLVECDMLLEWICKTEDGKKKMWKEIEDVWGVSLLQMTYVPGASAISFTFSEKRKR